MKTPGRTRLLAISLTASLLLLAFLGASAAGAAPTHRAKSGKVGVAVAKRVVSGQPSRRRHGHRPSPQPQAGETQGSGGEKGETNGETKPTRPTKPTPVPTPVPTPIPTPTPTPTPSPSGRIIFASGFEGSFKGFYVQSLSSRATISTAHPFAGGGAGRFEVRPGDVEPDTGMQRSEVSGMTFNENEEFFLRDEIRVPEGYSFQGPWQLINQLHETNWGRSPGIATFLDPSRRISFGAGDGSPMYWRGPALEPERWYTFVYHVKLSRDPNQGFAEVWLDGVPQTLSNGALRMYGETIQTSQTYFKAGLYRSASSSGVSVIEHDNIVIGTTLAAVMSF